MRSARCISVVSCLLIIGLALISGRALAQKSIDGSHDISGLMAVAESEFDLAREDAVLLLDALRYDWTGDGRLTTHVHRIIWINTDVGTDIYGDHRITYDNAHRTFNVITVRTWRDGQWWETGPTGIVETLPPGLRNAYNYNALRDMMLLHNGIELPCILEVAYSIEDKKPFRKGADGMWLFSRREPAVLSRFELAVPAGESPKAHASETVPEPERTTDDRTGLDVYRWTMGPLPAHPLPRTDDPATYLPHIVWSTWGSWGEYGDYLRKSFVGSMKLDSSLIHSLDSLTGDARTDAEKTQLIARFVDERSALIDISEEYFRPSPRLAFQTYAAAYGHRLDRAILAAALYEKSGLQARPVFLSRGYGDIDEGVPTLARMNGIGVWVSGEDVEAYYDPGAGTVNTGLANTYSRSIWLPGEEETPSVRSGGKNEAGLFELQISMKLEAGKDTISGDGFIVTANCLNAYDQMTGLSEKTKAFFNSVISGLIPGAKITEYNFSRFDLFKVTAGFKFVLKKPETDDYDRVPIETGDPAGGLFEHLPEDIALYDNERYSPVQLQCPMIQKVKLEVDLKDVEPVYLPEDYSLANDGGGFAVTVTEEDNHLVITRELKLAHASYPPDKWTELRALLLADRHERNRTLLFKQADNAGKKSK